MKAPTKKQRAVLDYLQEANRSGRPTPCVREMRDHFGLASTRAVCDRLDALERKGWIRRDPGKARSIYLVHEERQDSRGSLVDVPVLGHIAAGNAVEATEDAGRTLCFDIRTLGFRPSDKVFALIVRGDSMIGSGIYEGDTVIVDGGIEPHDGDVVAALIDNGCTLKTLVKTQDGVLLKPENPAYDTLIPATDLRIQGVARAVLRKLA